MNFEELGKKFRKLSQDTVTEVQKMNEVRQVNSRVNDQKKQIAALYSKMGQKLYDLYKNEPLPGFEHEFHELEERYALIEKFTDQAREIRGVRVCPNCHTEVPVTERFCSSCGEKMPEVLRIEEDEDGSTIIEGTASEVVVGGEEKEEPAKEAAKVDDAEPVNEETSVKSAEKISEEDVSEAESEEAADEETFPEDVPTAESEEIAEDGMADEETFAEDVPVAKSEEAAEDDAADTESEEPAEAGITENVSQEMLAKDAEESIDVDITESISGEIPEQEDSKEEAKEAEQTSGE